MGGHVQQMPSAVHRLQARAAQVGREIARTSRKKVAVGGGAAAPAPVVDADDWSEF